MKTRKGLAKGTRVRMTGNAFYCKLDGPHNLSTGVVTRDQAHALAPLRVRRDGARATETYHYSFWEIDKRTKRK